MTRLGSKQLRCWFPAHLVLGHHVSPVQEQHFDDLVAAEPRGIVQCCVTFLREM